MGSSDSRTVLPNGALIRELRKQKFGSREKFLNALGGAASPVSARTLGSIERGSAPVFTNS